MLPVVLDAERVLADQIICQLFDRGRSAFWFTLECGFSPTDEAIVGGYFYETYTWTRKKLFNFCDLHRTEVGKSILRAQAFISVKF